ncbi:hypothetical protein DCCM_3627 [Desulfocucumis palustris]|uniref:Uncharacterized protein n=1 Tax=Desulfocucumis palustris TaxID=1898651 RepID=A0A2L2XDS0_9FIRM|nr:hypothetical protein [Desulfocucumis palustris]GBF34509.1 hypothetical protein DCCM_3627 [Desulfocucumis palustris]
MLYLSLLFILAGTAVILTAVVTITWHLLSGSEKISWLQPGTWPDSIINWLKITGLGILSITFGMLWAVLGT